MSFLLRGFVLLCVIYLCNAGYGVPAPAAAQSAQADVQAPVYLPNYLRNQRFNGYSGTKTGNTAQGTRSAGTKTGYVATKTGYSRNSYSSTNYGNAAGPTGNEIPSGNGGMPPNVQPLPTNGGVSSYGGRSYPGNPLFVPNQNMPYTGPRPTGYGTHNTWYSSSGNRPTLEEFANNANTQFINRCSPMCQNNGICVDTNTCQCPPNYTGRYCEFEKKICVALPPTPMNSRITCSSEMCTVTCLKNHKFIDGTSVANLRCMEGEWRPTRADLTSLSDCVPQCDPACTNGGVCLSFNVCQCPKEFRGPQCQYPTSACDFRKLAFNGGYNCSGNDAQFSCSLSCPEGAAFSSPPAQLYTCRYATGLFLPQPIPHCVFQDVIVITPSNHPGGQNHESEIYHHHTGREHHTGMEVIVQDMTPKPGTCLSWAGTHYKTFDGKIYSFKSICQHILVREAREHKYTVAVRHGDCVRRSYCPTELTVYLEDNPYVLSVAEDGTVVFRNSKRRIPMPAALPGVRVAMPGQHVLVQLDALGVTIKWDTNNMILVEGSVSVWNNTEGLCGRLDGNPENDLSTREGSHAPTHAVMASSWQINQIGDLCEGSPSESSACASRGAADAARARQFCSRMFSKDKFRRCSEVMDVSLLEACQWDYCACIESDNPEECACNTVSVYAKQCLQRGVEEMRNWRDADTCPMQCPAGKLYSACGADAQPSCAAPAAPGAPAGTPAPNATCAEGCFCPPGLLLEAGRCVPPAQCPCRLRNRTFPPGAVVNKDCNTCSCSEGAWRCTRSACGARCGAVGDPHYTTFDGLKYDFMGHCTYTLLRSSALQVHVENVACSGAISDAMNLEPFRGEGNPSCTKAVMLEYGGAKIHLKQGGLIFVNDKEVSSLPVHVGDILIRAASSLFLIVQLPNGVDLWWDGSTRVFVDVPPGFRDNTTGLCGTFNGNQRDDFLTPEGDVEQSAWAFANKWKTRELCADAARAEPPHPCSARPEHRRAADGYCAKLRGKLFEPCHWHVDVEPYYEECVYDMCACAGDVARCLCPVLGDYAAACARRGVLLQWRYNVHECELQCTGGQEYTVCADSCQRTCADVALLASGRCHPVCVEGCACPQGQVLDSNNVCVPVGKCPCFHKGVQLSAGYKEVRPGRRELQLCTCVGARWDCVPATQQDAARYPPADDVMANCSAARHMEFTACQLAEPITCKNMHLPPPSLAAECRAGCACRAGYVLDAAAGACVPPARCPCHHGGRSYPDGHVMQEDCNTCSCQRGNWSCSARACGGACAAWGDSHVTTFDGVEYDFEGVCTYLLAKGSRDERDGFQVEIQNVPCGTTGATCSKSVTLKVGSGADEEAVSLTKDAPLPDVSALKRIKLREAGAFVFADVQALGVTLQWDRALRVYVRLDPMWQARVKGLCGNYNLDMRDDFQTPSGGDIAETSALIFADSWKLKPTCPNATPVKEYCSERPERLEWAVTACGALKRPPFSLCHAEVPLAGAGAGAGAGGGWVARCERDACACDAGGDCACACAALAAYADRCAARGVHFKWRTPTLCPMQCDEECSAYDACVPACPLETCDNTLRYAEIKATCEKDTCVEGCKPKEACPAGAVYRNSSHRECVPRAACRPPCLTLPGGRRVLEGELLEQDACHTCTCSKQQKICTGQPCNTTSAPTEPSTARPQLHEPLRCVPGWTEWLNRGTPQRDERGASVDAEPLPEPRDLQIGSAMCEPAMMKAIECRTVVTHETPKETGLDAECGLERGLLCREPRAACPDFEIRVLCECDKESREPHTTRAPAFGPTGRVVSTEPTTLLPNDTQPNNATTTAPFQCLNSEHPNYPHPSDCGMFYECTPDAGAGALHAVLKSCAEGLMYNPQLMVCDWPASVIAVRPECGIVPRAPPMTTTVLPPGETTPPCPPGHAYSACAFPCDQLCDHFLHQLRAEGKCLPGQKCAAGCGGAGCAPGTLRRDPGACVPPRDCTCDHAGGGVKPGGVVADGCRTCQCLENKLHCDSSACSPSPPPTAPTAPTPPTPPTPPTAPPRPGPTHQPLLELPTTTHIIILKSTVSPPPECSPDSYKNLLWEDEPLPPSAFTASSAASELFAPQHAILNGHPTDLTGGSWMPKAVDGDQYIQVELPRREPVHGVLLQGSPLYDQYVTSYQLLYGDDGHVFAAVDGPDGQPKIFRGPVDHENPMKQMLSPPVEARFVRLRPLTWHDNIAVRLELLGCGQPATSPGPSEASTTPEPLPCAEPLGLAAALPVENIEVSSNNEARPYLALDAPRGWRPLYSTPGEWLMFDFTSPRNITGIRTRGGPGGWVSAYNVLYTTDPAAFSPVVLANGTYAPFAANFDRDTAVANEFRPPLRARYLKLLPLKWTDHIEMRVEPLGCYEPYPEVTTPPPPPSLKLDSQCVPCPGIEPLTAEAAACECAPPTQHFDGQRCVTRDLCPCVEGLTTYAVGATFLGPRCDECVCKLGGVRDCKPVKECVCAPDLVPSLSPPSCACACSPCPGGTRICPTSKLCLPLARWCDGLLDCPDDEAACSTPFEPLVVTTAAPTAAAPPPTTTAAAPEKPKECPVVQCPPGYIIRYTSSHESYSISSTGDLPPPRPRLSYQRYQRGGARGYSRGGYAKGGVAKGGFAGFSKSGQSVPAQSQAFTLERPSVQNASGAGGAGAAAPCRQFRCVPALPPLRPGATPAPLDCAAPACPARYTLRLDAAATAAAAAAAASCPQYVCVPPPERPVYCNVTGRTFSTFDGTQYKYDICYHILARDNRLDAWTVLLRKKCRLEGCANQLLVRQDDQLILVKPDLMIEYDNYEYTVAQTNRICFQRNSFDLSKLGNGLAVKSRKYNFTVFYTPDGDVKIGVPKSLSGSVDGLCGKFDGAPANDRSLPDGRPARSLDEFGQAWAKPGLSPAACRTAPKTPEKIKRVLEMCDVITRQPLSECGRVLDLATWRSICLEKVCECSDTVVNGTRRSERECRCALLEQLVAECLAADKGVDLAAWRVQNDCPTECPPPLVHYDCFRKRCEPQCAGAGAGVGVGMSACPAVEGRCFPGCYCPEGTLRRGEQCVAPADCRDCVCDGVGSPAKYVTFERDELPLGGNCTYLASRDRNDSGVHSYQVYATNGPCAGSNSSEAVCTRAVHLLHAAHVLHVTRDPHTMKLQTTIDNALVYKYPVEKDWATVSLVNGQDVSVLVPAANLELRVQQPKMQFSVWVPSHVYADRTEGLCGVCAGYRELLRTSNGTLTDDLLEYGKSWQASPETLKVLDVPPQAQCDEMPPPEVECPLPPPDQNPCYNLLNVDKFGACHALVDPQLHVEACSAALCAAEPDMCGALELYADECRRQGVCLQWRGDVCPYRCQDPLVYRPCVDCERTCENYDELSSDPKRCEQQPVEGCFCPEGKVRVNNTCIEPTKCFPCDANKEHYAGDEWQENACVKCTCSKLAREERAHVACTTQTCTTPVCSEREDMITKPARAGVCCPDYMCVPKPEAAHCVEPKKMECGFGQVLKQRDLPNGCKEFACECKPASECEHIPTDSEVEMLEPGMEREVDRSGCCPRALLLCRRERCPAPRACAAFHEPRLVNVSGKCCPDHKCEPPQDKCVVTLEWEAAAKGGEKPRAEPQVVLKDLDAVWLDGPCRSCACAPGAGGAAPAPQCSVAQCAPPAPSADVVLEPRAVPFACCPQHVPVACRDADNIYKVGENWTSPIDVCVSYRCELTDSGQLEKVTTQQQCDTDCQPGWEYTPAPAASGKCCGACRPVRCVCEGVERAVGEVWRSPDLCTNYTCVSVDGMLQIQTSNESCPSLTPGMKRQYVYQERKVPGKCCSEQEPVACRVGDNVYQVGENWTSPTNPCVSYECRRVEGKLEKATTQQLCDDDCQLGWQYFAAAAGSGKCCGECRPVRCVCEGVERAVGEVWRSPDFCTHYTCIDLNGTLQIQSANESCPAVSEELRQLYEFREQRVPERCCSEWRRVACRDGDSVHEPGANWTSAVNPCESYQCLNTSGKVEKVTTMQGCDDDCQQGWEYTPAPASSGKCCGACRPVRCVCEGVERAVGEVWRSPDLCTNYTCVSVDGMLQIQTSNESCPSLTPGMKRQYVYQERKVPGKCCSEHEPVACRVGDNIYQVGENWTSPTNPCVSYECRRVEGKLEKATTQQLCDDDCQLGWQYFPAAAGSGKCCGECRPVRCVCEGVERAVGEVWRSPDFCTHYTCVDLNGTLQIQSANESCPAVSEELRQLYEFREQRVPERCCSEWRRVACRDGDSVHEPGANWTSAVNPCESYQCLNTSGKVEKVTTMQGCDDDCQQGWEYTPAPASSGKCCGACRPVRCVCEGVERAVGEVWRSPDLCTNYTCVSVDGMLQVQSSNETCPEIPESLRKQFVYEEKAVPGKCCKSQEPVACRDGNDIYQEGQTWSSGDPCRNSTCARDAAGRLARTDSVQACERNCSLGWALRPPRAGECCGRCRQEQCVADGQLRATGTSWQSADNCTTFSCERDGESVYMASASRTCPDVSACAPADLVNGTCCQTCSEKPSALSTCVATALGAAETLRLVRVRRAGRGLCVNERPLRGFRECRGTCGSGTAYNNVTGYQDSKCECCAPLQYEPLVVELLCEDGGALRHQLASAARCACRACGGGGGGGAPTKTGYSPRYAGTKSVHPAPPPPVPGRPPRGSGDEEFVIPEMFARFGGDADQPPR